MNDKNDKTDLSEKFFNQVETNRQIEQEFIRRKKLDIEYFNKTSSSLWISLVAPALSRLSHLSYLDRIDDMPDFAVAALLESKLSSLALNPLQVKGCTIQIEGNNAHFQISASISLNEAKEYLESLRMPTHH